MRRIKGYLLSALLLALPAPSYAAADFASPLSSLAGPKSGRALHEGSWDRKHQNSDFIELKPGEVKTLFEYRGSATVHRFWVTIAPRLNVNLLSQVILRMYWDDDPYPSVECPIGAFFGVGFGEQKDYISLPLNETSGGYNSYWPMPFHKSARWTLSNGSQEVLEHFYYNIDFTADDAVPRGSRHFHAQFRRENPTAPNKNYTILETAGAGHYVGTALFMAGRRLGFLEGNEMVYIDGSAKPVIEGTGTEDYFSSGWYFDRGLYSAPYHGVVIKDDRPARVSAYRWHIEDAIPFTKSIRFTIEHGAQNTDAADYSSVAYYYLAGPAPKPPSLPADLLPSQPAVATAGLTAKAISGAMEGGALKETSLATSGEPVSWNAADMDEPGLWSSERLLFWGPGEDEKEGTLILGLPASTGGKFEVVMRFVAGPDEGIVQLLANGKALGDPIDLFASKVEPKEVTIGPVSLRTGSNPLVIRFVGKNPQSQGASLGIDRVLLRLAR